MTENDFLDVVQRQVALFSAAPPLQKLKKGDFALADYHRALLTIFHQVYESASTFSLAAAFMESCRCEAKAYLMQHAEEEKLHWRWIISDLRNTGYDGPDPRTLPPASSAAAYIGYNYYIALKFPLGRLAIAATLESIGANFGGPYSARIMDALKLGADQVVFFRGHGDTDIGHTREIVDVLANAGLTSDEWSSMASIAETAGALYCSMYEPN